MPTLELHDTAQYMVTVGEDFDCTVTRSNGRAIHSVGNLEVKHTSDVNGSDSTVNIEHARDIIGEPYAGMGGKVGLGPKELLIWPPNSFAYVREHYRMPKE